MFTINLSLNKTIDDSYDICMDRDLFTQLALDLAAGLVPKANRYVVITDSNVEPLYAEKLIGPLQDQGLRVDVLTFPAGEQNKIRQTKADLEDQMIELGCGRDTCIIALGGGVTSDLAGFIAATYMRGIPYLIYSTTLLSAADASVGGKTAIDTPAGKNLVGAFYQPKRVYIDIDTWKTLPIEEIQSGLGETIKHAMLADNKFFEYLELNLEKIVSPSDSANQWLATLDPDSCLEIARRNVEIKYQVVQQDEKDTGYRNILNCGHTLGHAIEALSDYQLGHGLAIGLGLLLEARLSVELGYLPASAVDRLQSLLQRAGIPTTIPTELNVDEILAKTAVDKKASQGQARYVLLEDIGRMKQFENNNWTAQIDPESVKAMLITNLSNNL